MIGRDGDHIMVRTVARVEGGQLHRGEGWPELVKLVQP